MCVRIQLGCAVAGTLCRLTVVHYGSRLRTAQSNREFRFKIMLHRDNCIPPFFFASFVSSWEHSCLVYVWTVPSLTQVLKLGLLSSDQPLWQNVIAVSSLLASRYTSYSTVAPLAPQEAELSAGYALAIHLVAPVTWTGGDLDLWGLLPFCLVQGWAVK